jgi:hypothetical protein
VAVKRRTAKRKGAAAPREADSIWIRVVLLAAVVGAVAIRLAAARGELWLDEIWSFRLAHLQTDAVAVFTRIHHDNNHHLNTLYLYFLPESARWITYRAHAILAGVATVLMAGLIAHRAGARAALFSGLLTAGSFLLILYSSEARGYALAVFFAFVAVLLAERYLQTCRAAWALGFGAASALGFLSHLTFFHAYAGLFVWTSCRAFSQPRSPAAIIRLAWLHVLPVAVLAGLYWIDLRHVILGGGPIVPASEVVARVLSLAIGGPEDGGWRGLSAATALVACVAAVLAVRRSGSDLWILFGITIIVSPLLSLLLVDSNLLYERYFLIPAGFLLVASGWTLSAVARRSAPAAMLIVMAFLVTNGLHVARLLRYGRGNYLPALTYISSRAVQHPVTVGGDHDFRQGRLVEFYRPYVTNGSDIEYHQAFEWAAAGPEWFLVHSQEPVFAPSRSLVVDGGRRYTLSAAYPFGGGSGWHLAVYHNDLAEGR